MHTEAHLYLVTASEARRFGSSGAVDWRLCTMPLADTLLTRSRWFGPLLQDSATVNSTYASYMHLGRHHSWRRAARLPTPQRHCPFTRQAMACPLVTARFR